ncbi:hypothetical protein [Candidatus Nitrosocosmicus sp. T]
MVKVTHPLRSAIIQKYLYALSLNKIANETGVSKTTAHNVIYDWNSRLASMDLDEIRRFTSEMGKSCITVQQCVQGFRTFQMLKEFEINDEFDAWIDEDTDMEDKNLDSKKNQNENSLLDHIMSGSLTYQVTKRSKENKNSDDKDNQISYFIKSIYKNCKTHGIAPSVVIRWMEDLFDSISILDTQSNLNRITNAQKQNKDYSNEEMTQSNELDKKLSDEIPLISRISHFIEQKKKEIKHLENSKKSIYQDIDRLDKRKENILSDLTKTIEKEKIAFTYLQWYNNLKQELHDKYHLAIEEKYGEFAKVINDFKDYDFDASIIINEYKEIESLRQEKDLIQTVINLNAPVRNELLNQIAQLQQQMIYSKQTMNIYNELLKIGFGLKELKQLHGTIVEVSLANKMKIDEAVSKFLKDIENQYDNKLGLETTINNLKYEKKKLEDEVPQYQWYLQLQGTVAPIIVHLNSNGVTNEDIISINQLVIAFKNTSFVDEISNQQGEGEGGSKMIDKSNRSNNEYWKLFIEKLKSLKNINLEIARQSTILSRLKTHINNLNGKKQEIEKLYLGSVSNLNYILTQTSYSIELTKQINQQIDKKILMAPRFSPVFMNLIMAKSKDEKEEDEV